MGPGTVAVIIKFYVFRRHISYTRRNAAAEQVYRIVYVIDGNSIITLERDRIRCTAPEGRNRAQRSREAARAKNYVIRRPGEHDAVPNGDSDGELIASGLALRFASGAQPHDWCRP
jgi:hypothetical protein